MNWQNQNILVAGLGGTGLSMIAFLREHGARVCAYDANLTAERETALKQQFPDLICFSDGIETALMNQNILALSPGISERSPEIVAFKQRGGKVVGDIEILAQTLLGQPDKIIAITGSNGKTTVTSLVGHLCQQSGLDTVIAGNIGTPVLEAYMQRSGKNADVWVLELSSFQLENTESLHPDAATVLNISEDHLDRYDDLLDYAHAKDKIFRGNGVQILNADDILCCAMKRTGRNIQWFSLEKTADYWFDKTSCRLKNGADDLIAISDIPLQGLHNMANVLAATALCEAIGLKRETLLPHILSFKGLPHRVEKVGEKNGVVFIDDSKGTNVGATAAAIAGLQNPLWVILGGMGKGQDFKPLVNALNGKAKAVLLIGVDAPQIRQDLRDCTMPLIDCATLQEAVQTAYSQAKQGDIILLSPACASFDMFKGYAHRSEVFIEAFNAL